jgi:hypothetical protein
VLVGQHGRVVPSVRPKPDEVPRHHCVGRRLGRAAAGALLPRQLVGKRTTATHINAIELLVVRNILFQCGTPLRNNVVSVPLNIQRQGGNKFTVLHRIEVEILSLCPA